MIEISYFKKRSLDLLNSKNEEQRIYPIARNDLLWPPRRSCPICDSDNTSVLAEVCLPDGLMFFSTAVCCECLYIFRPISPSHDWFRKCWKIIAEDNPQVFNPEMEKFRAARYEQYRALLSKYSNGERTVLDIGAGYGTGAQVFKAAGFHVDIVEPEENRIKYIRKHYDFSCFPYSAEEFITEWTQAAITSNPRAPHYDCIIFSQCLEHMDDPIFAMNNIGRLLNPRGILYVEIPLVWEIVDWSDALFLAHKSNFTRENFTYLTESAGFEVLESAQYRNGPDEPLDYGLVLKSAKPGAGNHLPKTSLSDVDGIRQLYRKGLPENCTLPLNEVIRYRVSHIEQFYYTMRLDKIKFKMENGYVCLER